MDGARRAGFHATAKINREDFGLTWNVALESGGWLVGKDIKIEIDLAVEEAGAGGRGSRVGLSPAIRQRPRPRPAAAQPKPPARARLHGHGVATAGPPCRDPALARRNRAAPEAADRGGCA